MKKILFSVLTLFLITGCGEKKEESQLEELSLENEVVLKIVDKFRIIHDLYTLGELTEGGIYENEGLNENDLYKLVQINSKNLIKYDKDCKNDYFENEDYYYQCEYIEYTDFNNIYISLTGRNLPKKDLEISLVNYIYDSEKDVYKLFHSTGGGGTDLVLVNKIEKIEQDKDYIYIYEKVAFVWPKSDYNGYTIRKKNKKEVDIGNYEVKELKEKIIENNIDSFDTYKWTFKKDTTGEYIYESLEYVPN